MSRINQPVNQVRLTNVAIVRMNQHGKRFEIACYRNKILNYRQKIETDLSEVLQTDRVFTNVSKGLFAPTKDLQLAFGTTDQELICRIILDKGQIQVSDMERSATLENTAREIANMVATKCVHPVSNRPYTTSQIRDAMKAAEFVVQPTTARSVKQQFLDCVKAIQDKGVLDIQRAKMELAIVFSLFQNRDHATSQMYKDDTHNDDYTHLVDTIKQQLKDETEASFIDATSNPGYVKELNQTYRLQFLIDPSKYRAVESITKKYNGITLEIVRQTVTQEGDVDVSTELERMMNNAQQQQQQQQQQQNNNKSSTLKNSHDDNEENTDNDNDVAILSNNIKSCTISNNQDTHNESDEQDNNSNDDDEEYSTTSSRKKNKQAQKKSKKAKRREKEEASLRQARIDAENTRREERESRLLASSSIMNEGKQQQQQQHQQQMKQHPLDFSMEKEEGSCKSCNTCGGSFTPAQYRVHFRSDWHRYNIKLKMKGLAAVDEKEFLLIDSDAFFDDLS